MSTSPSRTRPEPLPRQRLLDEQAALREALSDEVDVESLLLTDDHAMSALRASDVQALLDSVIQGTCVLSGQTEPFIWLVGRLADRRCETMTP